MTPRRSRTPEAVAVAMAVLLLPLSLAAQEVRPGERAPVGTPQPGIVPDPGEVTALPASELRPLVERFTEDRRALGRRYGLEYSPERRARMADFLEGWRARLEAMPYEPLDVEGRIDWHLLMNDVRYGVAVLERREREMAEMAPLLPFFDDAAAVVEGWRRFQEVEPRDAAEAVVALAGSVEQAAAEAAATGVSPVVALRAAGVVVALRRELEEWYDFRAEYDPLFTWWVVEPWERLHAGLEAYATVLREELAGADGDRIIGDPSGAEGLESDLDHEMIPYGPAELVAIAEEEFRWIEEEMRRAAREMGHGDDWRAALEEVKTRHVEPGEQPELVRELAQEAVDFLEARELVTIPPLAEEIWRMTMLSPARQRIAPFFLGGEVVQIAFPTSGMSHEDKLMSLRGNNVHFSRAVVHHELIPGHHLQGFMTERYNPHRSPFGTPFWGEGWALWWEFLLYDEGFARTPEDRMGMLFWRAHRAARIIFSLSFHLGTMTPEEAVDFLVERVGHERANAEAEVRRSFIGSYPPVYQAAYMLGALQFRALHAEVVEGGSMGVRDFHDRILRGGRMPVELVRARITGTLLPRDYRPSWRFAGDPGR